MKTAQAGQGYTWANNHSAKSTPEHRLACAVVFQAFLDCRALLRKEGLDGLRRSEPYTSLAYPNRSMRMWCELADIDPDAMADRVRRGMRTEKSAVEMLNRTLSPGCKANRIARDRNFVKAKISKALV